MRARIHSRVTVLIVVLGEPAGSPFFIIFLFVISPFLFFVFGFRNIMAVEFVGIKLAYIKFGIIFGQNRPEEMSE